MVYVDKQAIFQIAFVNLESGLSVFKQKRVYTALIPPQQTVSRISESYGSMRDFCQC